MINQPLSIGPLAVMANSAEHLALLNRKNVNFYLVVLANTALFKFAAKNFNRQRIIPIKYLGKVSAALPWSLAIDDLIKKSDLTSKLAKAGVKYFMPPYRSSVWLEKWAAKNNFQLVVTPFKIQQQLENKSYFDKLLKKNNLPSPATISNFKRLPIAGNGYVAQQATVSDYFRTTFLKNNAELKGFLSAHQAKLKNLVIRQYLPGLPIGVSIFIDSRGNYFFSALRRQCFDYRVGWPEDFIGLQWLASSFLPQSVNRRANLVLKKLAAVLVKTGFKGVANVDFIVYQKKVFILECNPRLSVAMPQVFFRHDLTVYQKPFEFFTASLATAGSYAKIKLPVLTKTGFKGSVLELSAERRFTVKNPLPVGVYSFRNNRLKHLGAKFELLTGRLDRFLLFHELIEGMVLKRGYALASVFANFPLFDSLTGSLNQLGRNLRHQLQSFFTKKS